MNIKLAQTQVDPRPAPVKGERVILDESVQSVPNIGQEKTISKETYYLLGALVLLIIAGLAIYSLYYKNNGAKIKK